MAIATAVISAAAATFLGGPISATATSWFLSSTMGSFLTRAAIGLALNALSPKPKDANTNRGYTLNNKGSVLDHQIIYGRMKVGGVVVFDETDGSSDKYLHRVIAFAGHEVEDFEEIWINDTKVTSINPSSGNINTVLLPDGTSSDRYSGYIRIQEGLGTSDQVANASLVNRTPSWTNNHRLQGIAYLYVRLRYDADVFPNGVPTITAVVKGKKVYDPRSGLTAWSDNPALCIRDYLTSKYGLNEDSANVDDTLVSAAANICDQTNTLAGTTRYTCNGAFTTAQTPYDTLQNMLTSMGGLLWYAQGEWRMKPAYWTTPTLTLTEDDLRSSIAVKTRHSRRDNFNTVKGTFKGEETNWQVSDYPEVTNSAFVAVDNGQESVVDIELPFTDNSVEARRIARIALERNRQQLTVSASFGLRAFQAQVGDVINLTVDRFGWSSKSFEVISWTFGLVEDNDLQVQMTLREISESVFDEVDDGIIYERDNTNLLDALTVPNVGLTLSTELKVVNEQAFGVINVQVDSNSDIADYFEVQFKKSSDTKFKSTGTSTSQDFEILIPEDDTYDIRARAVNPLGVRGQWSTTTDFSAKPFAPPPEDVANFGVNIVGGIAQLSWDAVSDLDLSHYEIRYSSKTSGVTWSNSVLLVSKVARPATNVSVPARQGTYLIKAVDKVGGKSVNATTNTVVVDLDDVLGLNVVQNYNENPSYSGSKTNVVVVTDDNGSPYLTLDTSDLFDSTAGDFDDPLGLFDGGGGTVLTTGTYDFANVLDLGAKYTTYIKSSIEFQHLDYVNTFDSAEGLFDARGGDFDGDPDAIDTSSVKVQMSFTDDDPSGTPAWSQWEDVVAAEVSARAIRFRAILTSKDPQVAPRVDVLTAEVDMPDRTEAQNDLNFTGSLNVSFPSPFYSTSNPAVGLSLTGLGTGDYYTITSKDNTGFTITVYDSTDTQLTTSTQLDYVAKGFGKEIA